MCLIVQQYYICGTIFIRFSSLNGRGFQGEYEEDKNIDAKQR